MVCLPSIKGFLFDLDGTLLDTHPDLSDSFNVLLKRYDKSECDPAWVRSSVSHGLRFILNRCFTEADITRLNLIQEYLQLYENNLNVRTQLFEGTLSFLKHLADLNIPWGIVSNKSGNLVQKLVQHYIPAYCAPICVIGGDTYSFRKPHPYPVEQACRLLDVEPTQVMFLGDAESDVLAGKASGCMTGVALYGYLSPEDDPLSWNADMYIQSFVDLNAVFPN